jgi:hypothetical protein
LNIIEIDVLRAKNLNVIISARTIENHFLGLHPSPHMTGIRNAMRLTSLIFPHPCCFETPKRASMLSELVGILVCCNPRFSATMIWGTRQARTVCLNLFEELLQADIKVSNMGYFCIHVSKYRRSREIYHQWKDSQGLARPRA